MSLDKVLRLAQQPERPVDASEYVRAASDDLERLALLLAQQDGDDEPEDDDEDGDSDQDSGGGSHSDHPAFKALLKKKVNPKLAAKMCAKSDGKSDKVKATRALVLDAMVALSQLSGGEVLSLSVLTQAEREKSSAHTIPGSTDFPIPDKVHLSAALARYKQGKLAGHSRSQVAAHIRKHARRLGEQVDLVSGGDGDQVNASSVMALARAEEMVNMDHTPMTGKHKHPHRVVSVHDHEHVHNNDSRHMCGESGVFPGAVY